MSMLKSNKHYVKVNTKNITLTQFEICGNILLQ